MAHDSRKPLSSAAVQRVYEQRCQAHVAVNGRNPSPIQKEHFKKQVVELARKKNVDEGRS